MLMKADISQTHEVRLAGRNRRHRNVNSAMTGKTVEDNILACIRIISSAPLASTCFIWDFHVFLRCAECSVIWIMSHFHWAWCHRATTVWVAVGNCKTRHAYCAHQRWASDSSNCLQRYVWDFMQHIWRYIASSNQWSFCSKSARFGAVPKIIGCLKASRWHWKGNDFWCFTGSDGVFFRSKLSRF